MSGRIRSIRTKDDPEKPCNVAYREGQEAKAKGLLPEACPYDGRDSYSAYLRWHWVSGYDPLLNCHVVDDHKQGRTYGG